MTRSETKTEWGLLYEGTLTRFRAITRAQCRQLRKMCEDCGSHPRRFKIVRVITTEVWTDAK
jgi:hypothetical protein